MKPDDTVIYTAQKRGLDPDKRYANPRFFSGRPKSGIRKVTVVGNWPVVVAAYEAVGADVTVVRTGEPAKAPHGGRVADPADVPDNWRGLDWDGMREVAGRVSDVPAINRDEAVAMIEAAQPAEKVAIPDDWETLHWAKQEKLAQAIAGGDGPLDTGEDETRAEKAKAIIAAEVANRG